MSYEVTLPSLGEDAAELAIVSQWLVKKGDTVAEGDDLVEMTTDKAAFNVPSPAAGTVAEILATEGQEVKAGGLLCILE